MTRTGEYQLSQFGTMHLRIQKPLNDPTPILLPRTRQLLSGGEKCKVDESGIGPPVEQGQGYSDQSVAEFYGRWPQKVRGRHGASWRGIWADIGGRDRPLRLELMSSADDRSL